MMLRSQQGGMALVIVLWIVALLSVMAGSFAYSMRTETTLVTHTLERAQALALAEAGVMYAITHAVSQQTSSDWPVDGSEREWRFGPGIVRINIIDSAGKIDLNHASRGLLEGLLTSAGVAEEKRKALLDAIEDWRDSDDLRRLHGAEADDYRAAGRVVGPKNALFESVQELQQVLGMTSQIYQRVAEALTVYSSQEAINPAFAPVEVLAVVPGLNPEIAAQYVALREQSVAQVLPPPFPAEAQAAPYLSQGSGGAYHIRAEATLPSGSRALVEAVITARGGGNQPYTLLSWREGR